MSDPKKAIDLLALFLSRPRYGRLGWDPLLVAAQIHRVDLGGAAAGLDKLSAADFGERVIEGYREKPAALKLCEVLPALSPEQINRAIAADHGVELLPEHAIKAARAALEAAGIAAVKRAHIAPLLELALFDLAWLAVDGYFAPILSAATESAVAERHLAGLGVTLSRVGGMDKLVAAAWQDLRAAVCCAIVTGRYVATGRLRDLASEEERLPLHLWAQLSLPKQNKGYFEFGRGAPLLVFDPLLWRAEDAPGRDAAPAAGEPAPSPALRQMMEALDQLAREKALCGVNGVKAAYRLVMARCDVIAKARPPVGMTYESFRRSPEIRSRLAKLGIIASDPAASPAATQNEAAAEDHASGVPAWLRASSPAPRRAAPAPLSLDAQAWSKLP